jgi:hypothetical protein
MNIRNKEKAPMKSTMKLLLVAAFALLIAAPAALAQIPETSTLPVTEPLDVGGTILQPGTYTITVLKRGDDNRVTILDQAGNAVASVLTIPHQLEPNEEIPNTTFVYFPAGEGQPRALRTWFPPDPASRVGRDIVYDEARTAQLMRLAQGETVTTTTQTQIVDTTPVVTPAPAPVYVPEPAPAPMTSAAPVETAEVAPVEMPQTAGELPLVALFGLLSVVAAVGIRFARGA